MAKGNGSLSRELPRFLRKAERGQRSDSLRPHVMRWSFKVARIAGTEVRIHITFLLGGCCRGAPPQTDRRVEAKGIDGSRRDLPTVRADEPFDKAFQLTQESASFQLMQESAFPALPMVNRFGRLRGLITRENVGELMMVSTLLPETGRPARRDSSS